MVLVWHVRFDTKTMILLMLGNLSKKAGLTVLDAMLTLVHVLNRKLVTKEDQLYLYLMVQNDDVARKESTTAPSRIGGIREVGSMLGLSQPLCSTHEAGNGRSVEF